MRDALKVMFMATLCCLMHPFGIAVVLVATVGHYGAEWWYDRWPPQK